MEANILINIGDLPAQPGIQGCVEISSGKNIVARTKEIEASALGVGFEFFNIYAFINCTTAEGAELVKARLTEIIPTGEEEDINENGHSFFGQFFNSYLGSKFTIDISVQETKVLIHAAPGKKFVEKWAHRDDLFKDEEAYESFDKAFHIEFDMGHEIGTILGAENKILEALNALRFKFSFNRAFPFSERYLNSILSMFINLDAFSGIISHLTMLQSGNIQLNLKSLNELPEFIKEETRAFIDDEEFRNLVSVFCPKILTYLGELAEHTTGDISAYWSTNEKFQKFILHAPGIFNAFSALLNTNH